MITKYFTVGGMTCHSCKKIIEMTASDFSGIKKCEVDYKSGIGFVEYDNGFNPEQFGNEINKMGKYNLEFNS